VAYQLAPRLNACGRIGRVQAALDLLLTRDASLARDLAREADETNDRRKLEDQRVEEEALRLAAPFAARGDAGLVLASPTWHKGVIGISAARLVEAYDVPTVLCSVEGAEARGSARSVVGVDVKAALDHCSDLLVRYGGHAQAAGMTLRADNLERFRERFCAALRALPGSGDATPRRYDLNLPLGDMTADELAELCGELTLLEPYGEGNPKPVFQAAGLRLSRLPAVIGKGKHLRFAFAGPAATTRVGTPALSREFISFGSAGAWTEMLRTLDGGAREALDGRWDALFQIKTNTWRPRSGAPVDPVQLQLVDIRRSAT
jgi:single-stranded-DNA-specific exonuclease